MLAKLDDKQHTAEVPKHLLSSGNSKGRKEKLWKGLRTLNRMDFIHDDDSYSGDSASLTPSSDTHSQSFGSKPGSGNNSIGELQRLKEELAVAKCQIARMDLEISQNKITKHTIDQALSSPSDQELFVRSGSSNSSHNEMYNRSNGKNYLAVNRDAAELGGKSQSEFDSSSRYTTHPCLQAPWDNDSHPYPIIPGSTWTGLEGVGLGTNNIAQKYIKPALGQRQNPRAFTNNRTDNLNKISGNLYNSGFPAHKATEHGLRRFPSPFNRSNSAFGALKNNQGWSQFANNGLMESISSSPSLSPASFNSPTMFPAVGRPIPVGARLSPTAVEFENSNLPPTPWNTQVRSWRESNKFLH